MTTSLPIVPSKFYQVCRLCMNVVSDTNDLVNLSVFDRSNGSSCIGPSAHCEIAESPTTTTTTNSGVIVKTATTKSGKFSARKLSTTRKSSTHSDHDNNENTDGSNGEHDNNDDDHTTVTNNSSDNEAAGADDVTADDEAILNNNNNFKIDSTVNSQQSDVLERIQTFLSITVSDIFPLKILHYFFLSSCHSTISI